MRTRAATRRPRSSLGSRPACLHLLRTQGAAPRVREAVPHQVPHQRPQLQAASGRQLLPAARRHAVPRSGRRHPHQRHDAARSPARGLRARRPQPADRRRGAEPAARAVDRASRGHRRGRAGRQSQHPSPPLDRYAAHVRRRSPAGALACRLQGQLPRRAGPGRSGLAASARRPASRLCCSCRRSGLGFRGSRCAGSSARSFTCPGRRARLVCRHSGPVERRSRDGCARVGCFRR